MGITGSYAGQLFGLLVGLYFLYLYYISGMA